jgi:hypothetical protein
MTVMMTAMVMSVVTLGVMMKAVAAQQRIVGRREVIGFIASTTSSNQRNRSDQQQ